MPLNTDLPIDGVGDPNEGFPEPVDPNLMEEQFPELAEAGDITQRLQNAVQDARPGTQTDNAGWNAEFNERNVFEAMYNEAALSYYESAAGTQAQGRQVLRLFSKWKPMVQLFTLLTLRGDTPDSLGATLNFEPEGSTQAYLRPLRRDSFYDTDDEEVKADYEHVPTEEGSYNLIPNDGGRIEADENEQAYMIFGYIEYSQSRTTPYDYIQEDINDSLGVRREINTRHAFSSHGNLRVLDRDRGPLIVEPGHALDIDVNVTQPGVNTQLFPVGVEVIIEDHPASGGIMDDGYEVV